MLQFGLRCTVLWKGGGVWQPQSPFPECSLVDRAKNWENRYQMEGRKLKVEKINPTFIHKVKGHKMRHKPSVNIFVLQYMDVT